MGEILKKLKYFSLDIEGYLLWWIFSNNMKIILIKIRNEFTEQSKKKFKLDMLSYFKKSKIIELSIWSESRKQNKNNLTINVVLFFIMKICSFILMYYTDNKFIHMFKTCFLIYIWFSLKKILIILVRCLQVNLFERQIIKWKIMQNLIQ